MPVEALIKCARQYCDWGESTCHDMETGYGLLLSLRDAAERLPPPAETGDRPLDLSGEVGYQEANRFADFPFQIYPASYWANRPLPETDNIHVNFAWIFAQLRCALQALDRGDIADPVAYWHDGYFFRWGHHLSAAIWAIEWYKRGEQDASPNGGPAEPLGNSGIGGGPPSVS